MAERFKASFDALLRVHHVGEHVYVLKHQITRSQKPMVKTKIESVRARLNRIGEERDAVKNTDELGRRKTLFECVFPTCCG